ncbi:MAG: guanine deaminase [Leptolyngbyaceae cyanobacterium MO_188.B28]|nr:guanine deaminase [Leptolyngbyaceae cyanobacterium MO_188.B28]
MTSSVSNLKAFRSSFLDFVGDPFYSAESDCVRYFTDGLLVVEGDRIKALGNYENLRRQYPEVTVAAYPGKLILPGFVDIHVHYPQTEMIAAYGQQLLDWLNQYVFPVEEKFKDAVYARGVASFFLDQLLCNGTTTAVALTTIFPQSVDVLFEEAKRRNMRLIAGMMMMDRNAPDFLLTDAQTADRQNRDLIQKWSRTGRLSYAITPRFAITSTEAALQSAGRLKADFPEVYVHTHLSENIQEVALTAKLFPTSTDYLNVYEQFGLVGDKSIFAHGVQLSDPEFERLSEAEAALAFCPTSNLFLGSGLFNLEKAKSATLPVKVGLATDVGAGTSFSMLQTISDAYKVTQLQGQNLSPFKALFLATLGGARALSLDDKIGSFEVGKEADFVVLDMQATPLMAFRNSNPSAQSLDELAEKTFAMMILGDDRAIQATYIAGDLAYARSPRNKY